MGRTDEPLEVFDVIDLQLGWGFGSKPEAEMFVAAPRPGSIRAQIEHGLCNWVGEGVPS